jgi:DNA-binding CsgD family transcriptional regulator
VLPARDYERMLDLAVSIMDYRNADTAWSLVADELMQSLRGITCTFSHSHHFVDGVIQFDHVEVWTPWYCGVLAGDAPEWERARAHPLVQHYGRTRERAPLTVSDLIDGKAWRATETYDALRRTSGATRHISLPLHDLDGVNRGFVLGRSGTDFTDRERAYVQRLQPLLGRVDAHLRHLRRWQDAPAPPEDCGDKVSRAAALHVTARELTVLALLADGLTAATIGRRLRISPRTVHRHLDSLYRKLGTADRLNTVLHAQRLGLLPSTDSTVSSPR